MRTARISGTILVAFVLVVTACPAVAPGSEVAGHTVRPVWAQVFSPDPYESVEGDDGPENARPITSLLAAAGGDYTEAHTLDRADSAPPFESDEDWSWFTVPESVDGSYSTYLFEAIPAGEPVVYPVIEVYGPVDSTLPAPHDPLTQSAPALDPASAATGLGDAWFDHLGTSVVFRPEASGAYFIRVRPYGDDSGDGYEARAGEYTFRAKSGSVVRLAGADRYATAVAISRERYADGMLDGALEFDNYATVLVASGENYPDALAGSFLAGVANAPILLTRSLSLPAVTAEELRRLAPDNVVVLGGTGAVADAVIDEIEALFPATAVPAVTRSAGTDRIETAIRIAADGAELHATRAGESLPRGCIIANARNFPDALSASAASAGGLLPIMLTDADALDPRVEAAIEQMQMTDAIIVGGTGVVSSAVESRLKQLLGSTRVIRLAGDDRYETSSVFASWLVGLPNGVAQIGTPGNPVLMPAGRMFQVAVATGQNFPDALAAGPSCGRGDNVPAAPLLLTPPTLTSPWILDPMGVHEGEGYFESVELMLGEDPLIGKSYVFGGSGAVSDTTWRELDEYSGGR